MLYLWGPGRSGKDTVLLIFLKFFGGSVQNYSVVLNGGFLVAGRATCKEAASPFLAATQGKRLLWKA